MLLVMNAHSDVVGFKLSDCTDGKEWRLLLDTNVPMKPATSASATTMASPPDHCCYSSCKQEQAHNSLIP